MAVKVSDFEGVERTLPEASEVGEYARSRVLEEKNRAVAKEFELNSSISAESTRAQAKESEIDGRVDKEILDREQAIESEATERKAQDDALSQRITQEVGSLSSSIASKLARVDGATPHKQVYAKTESGSQTMVDFSTESVGGSLVQRDGNGRITVLDPSQDTDAVNKKYVDSKTTDLDQSIAEKIAEETSRAQAAESTLQSGIDKEVQDRTTAISQLTQRVATEESNRQQGDTANASKIQEEVDRAQAAESSLRSDLDGEISRSTQQDTAISQKVSVIEQKIPSQASSSNQLADKAFVTDSISRSAANRVSYDSSGSPFPTRNALFTATTFYHAGSPYTPDEHDYAIVVADEGAPSPFTGGQTRFERSGSTWEYSYGINERPFTSEEQAAIDSGITAQKVAEIDTKLPKSSVANSLYGTDQSGSQIMVPKSTFYSKPSTGIPKTDLAQSVQNSLNKADSALQEAPVTSVNGKTGAVTVTPSSIGAEPSFTKNTAFNKNFGTSAGTVCEGNDSRLSNARPASDVYAWAKSATKPSYTKAEVGLGNVDNVKQYSASNPPPYPVTSVNGKTGAVSITSVESANSATKATQDGSGNVITDTYATKTGTYPNLFVGNATNATNASYASSAGNATNATNATTADKVSHSLTAKVNTTTVTFDGSEYVTIPTIFAPSTGGSIGQYLKGAGSNSKPVWGSLPMDGASGTKSVSGSSVNVTHGLGIIPSEIFCQLYNPSNKGTNYYVTSKNSTTFTVSFYSSGTAGAQSITGTLYWLAIK